jgi:hypothetical protein
MTHDLLRIGQAGVPSAVRHAQFIRSPTLVLPPLFSHSYPNERRSPSPRITFAPHGHGQEGGPCVWSAASQLRGRFRPPTTSSASAAWAGT